MDENRNEIELLRIENNDLKTKLETLTRERKVDYPKLTEYERNLAELEALRKFKSNLFESNSKLQRRLQEKEKEVVELSKINKEKLERLSELEQQLEMTAIEKEMAEEKTELLQADIEFERQHVQELEIELNLFRSKTWPKDDVSQDCGIQLKILECQNVKLREAVERMRDFIGQLAEDKRELTKENEMLRNESVTSVEICERLKNDLQKAEQTICILKDRIDATMDSEKMIENLTEKNMDLEKRLSTLEETVEDYEAIRSMDEEILETQREVEKELKEELDLTNSRMNNLLIQIKIYGEQVDKYEKMIIRFRQKISELNEEIQEKQDAISSLNEQIKGEINSTMSMRSTHLTIATRTFAELVDREVYPLELKYEIALSNYLKAFLPDSFWKPGGDGDAVLLTVRCSRLLAKTTVLAKLVNLKYPPSPDGIRREHVTKSLKAEQWAHCAKLSFFLSNFSFTVRQFESVLHRCSAERLLRLAPLHSDIAKEEKIIDKYMDLLRSDKFDENTPIDDVIKAANYLENILSIHFCREWYDVQQLFLDFYAHLLQGLCWVKISVQRIIFTFPHSTENSTNEYMKSVLIWVERCEQLCTRLKNRILISENITFTQDLEIQLSNWNMSFKNVASVFDNVCSILSTQLSTMTEADSLEENCIEEAFSCSVEKMHGALNGANATEIMSGYMEILQCAISDLIDKFDNEKLLSSPVDKSFPSPIMERANARKQDALEAEELCWCLEKKENEIMELKRNLRAKLDDISNYKIRLEMAENKIESMGKTDNIDAQKLRLQNEDLRDQLRKARIEYEDTLECLQHEIEICEKENHELRNRARANNKKILLGQLQTLNLATDQPKRKPSITPVDSTSSTPERSGEVAYLENELKETKLALAWAYQSIRQLKVNERMQALNLMDPVSISSDISGPLTLLSVNVSKKDELDELCRRAENILADSRFYQIPYITDISQPKLKQDLEKRRYLENIAHVNERIADLKTDIQRFCNKYCKSGECPSLFTNIESITSNSRKKERVIRIGQLNGVHSLIYKNAFEALFGNLNAEQKRVESMEIAICV